MTPRRRVPYRGGTRKEGVVPTMLIRHKVADYGAWKAVFDEQEMTRRAHGARGGRVFRRADDPHDIVLLIEWDDPDRARLFAASDDLREAMERARVTDRPDIWVLKEVDDPREGGTRPADGGALVSGSGTPAEQEDEHGP
jgi:hypothetical protein